MTSSTGLDSRIENYLAQVRAALRGLPDGEIDDIQRELRSHVIELAGNDAARVDSALESLGDPVDLAKTYRAGNQMVQAECSGSPLVILQGLRHAGRSWLGRFSATVLYVLGYIYVVKLWVVAADKVIASSRTGLWYTPGNVWSLTLVTNGNPPADARELLGWWLIPIGVAAGWALRYVTDRVARWWVGRYRRQKASQEG
ncbi:MAG TPA: hypothetical protein VJN89_02430 [Candidatus Acidoferrum sp.]|nr:hypothetical protein [Candidatus Acidoferrum sp.]